MRSPCRTGAEVTQEPAWLSPEMLGPVGVGQGHRHCSLGTGPREPVLQHHERGNEEAAPGSTLNTELGGLRLTVMSGGGGQRDAGMQRRH